MHHFPIHFHKEFLVFYGWLPLFKHALASPASHIADFHKGRVIIKPYFVFLLASLGPPSQPDENDEDVVLAEGEIYANVYICT